MAVRRFDPNQNAAIDCAIGALEGINEGAFTLVALVKKETDGGFQAGIAARTDANSTRRGLFTGTIDSTPDRIVAHLGGFNLGGPLGYQAADGWAVIAIGKDAGDSPIEIHRGLLAGGTWTHDEATTLGFDDAPDTQLLTQVTLGAWPGVIGWNGLIGAAAAWKGRRLSAAELEAGFLQGVSAWLGQAPSAMWLLNQASIDDPILDITGNGADQTAITATSVEGNDDPPGFSFAVEVVDALANPSLWGWPDQTNTGLPTDTVLTPSGPLIVTNPGAIVEDLDIDGTDTGLAVEVRADNVTLRRCRITAIPQPGGGCIKQTNGATGLLVEDCELLYTAAGSYDACVGDSDYTLRRCHIHHVSEGPRVGASTTIEDCYIHTLLVDDPDVHADALQSTGGTDIAISHNTIVADQQGADFANAAAILGSESAASGPVTLTDNLLDGGGFTLFIGPSNFPMSDVTVTGNRFGRAAAFGPISIGAGIDGIAWSGNLFDDDNTEVPLVIDEPGAVTPGVAVAGGSSPTLVASGAAPTLTAGGSP